MGSMESWRQILYIYGEKSLYPHEVSGVFQLESRSLKIGNLPP
jgi:hypothetical protein